ncbi:DUF3253 domain-containing protein [Erythrobacter sp. THAF29]|uniref:DUF3253 domain-containing protein n=1 Tax=Erythrobacter sp. THAF29 TaxID=2587851 RepID=UPI00126876BA|nr:DUF3253 domain-containing protein [Erythrobacter sp. THAF29]QFT78789.1 hypothetical protein FIU90_14660 [Erythrobacter sp. THAF29]
MISANDAINELLGKRGPGKTMCPSEAAKRLTGPDGDWRENMGLVHRAVDEMFEAGTITLSWKGKRKEQRRGAYRIARR